MYNWSCPNCGKFIQSEITYYNGEPLIIYKCDCGWNSLNQTYVNSNKFEYKNKLIDK